MNRLLAVPVRRNLENRGPADAAMSEKHIFAERWFRIAFRAANGSNHLDGDSSQIAPALAVAFAEDERDKSGAWGFDLQAELPGQIVPK